jgi:hypothetical protein
MSTKSTTNQFINKSILIHNDTYDYSKVEYINAQKKVIIKCKTHGEFLQTPNGHLDGRGCIKCANDERKILKSSNAEEFIIKSKLLYNDLFDYSDVEYTKSWNKIKLYCKRCEYLFLQTPNNHLNGSGCPKCARLNIGWSHTNWKLSGNNSSYFESFKVYLIECFNSKEKFYKIGKTFVPIAKRFSGDSQMPYQYKVIRIIEGDSKTVSELEHQLHKECKEYSYAPETKFGGSQECFQHTEQIKEIFLQHCQ